MELGAMQEYALVLSKQNGWDSESLATRLAYLKEEVEEAINEINYHIRATSDEEKAIIKEKLGHELFDIIWNVAELANRFNIDLETASEQKMQINTNRTFSESPIRGEY